MRYYTPGDDIYFFGFSRGAYTARFLAEMLDHVGLLSVNLLPSRLVGFSLICCRLVTKKCANSHGSRTSSYINAVGIWLTVVAEPFKSGNAVCQRRERRKSRPARKVKRRDFSNSCVRSERHSVGPSSLYASSDYSTPSTAYLHSRMLGCSAANSHILLEALLA